MTYALSTALKNAPTLASCSLVYLLLNSCDGNDAKNSVFSSVDCWWLWKEPVPLKRAGFSVADVQSDDLSPSHMHVTDVSISAAYAVMRCPSVRQSVRLTRSWIMSKRINISSKFFHHRVATSFSFFHTKRCGDIPTGTPLTGASNADEV